MATRLLLIDSDAEFTRELKSALHALSFEVEVTTETESAIQLAKIDPPSVVVIGLMDARGTGYGVCSKLRRRVPDLPVLMVIDEGEAGSDRLKRHQMLKTRAQAYLVRPFTLQAFYDTVSASLDKPLPARTEDLSQRVGVLPTGAGAGELLFSADELDAIAAEADAAFDSLMTGEMPIIQAAEPPVAAPDAAVEFALSEADLEELPLDDADLVADADLLALDRDFDAFLDEPTTESFASKTPVSAAEAPAGPVPLATPPARTVIEEVTGSRDDMRALRARVVELQQEARLAHDELERRRDEASRRRAADNAARKEAMQLRGKLSEREQEIAELRTQLTGRDQEIIGLNETVDDRRADLEMAKSDLRHAEAHATAMESARAEAEAEIKRLEVLLDQARGDLVAADREIEAAKGETEAARAAGEAALEAAKAEHSAERTAQDEAHIAALAKAQAEAEAARGEIDARLAEQRTAFDAELAEAEQKQAEAAAEVEARAEAERATLADEHAIAISELNGAHAGALEAKDAEKAAALEAAAKAQAEAVEALEAEVAELKSAAESVEQAHQEALATLKGEVEAANELLEAAGAEHQAAIAALEGTHADALAEQKAELETAAEAAATEHAQAIQAKEEAHQLALDEADDRFLTETSKLDGRVTQLEADLKKTSDERAALTVQVAEAEKARDAQTALAEATAAELTEEKRLRADDVAERDARMVDLTQQAALHTERIAKLETSLAGLNEEIEVWEGEVSQREDEVAGLKARLAEHEARHTELNDTVAARDATIAELTEAKDALQAELDGLQSKADQLDELIEKARSAMGVARAFLEHTRPEDGEG